MIKEYHRHCSAVNRCFLQKEITKQIQWVGGLKIMPTFGMTQTVTRRGLCESYAKAERMERMVFGILRVESCTAVGS